MAHHIFEIYSAKTGRAVGYLPEDEEDAAAMMQRNGYIVTREEI